MGRLEELQKAIEDARKEALELLETKGGRVIAEDAEEEGSADSSYSNLVCNKIYLGNNIDVILKLLKEQNAAGKIQMIYVDPPFFSGRDYSAVLGSGDSKRKVKAYGDKWEGGLYEYLKELALSLILMKELLADTGTIWLHVDWHASHYCRILMDEVFGEKRFVNEVIWTYKSGGSTKKRFARKHDNLLLYSKSEKYRFNPLKEKSYNRDFKPYRFKGVEEFADEKGWYTMVNMKDVWQIDMVGRTSGERTGYATQKPLQLLNRIIESCTDEEDICADFFCGSGTLAVAAKGLGRKYICCDLSELAVKMAEDRLKD